MSSAARRFEGYGVLITGAARGIGEATARGWPRKEPASWITGTTLCVDGGLLAVNTAFIQAVEGD